MNADELRAACIAAGAEIEEYPPAPGRAKWDALFDDCGMACTDPSLKPLVAMRLLAQQDLPIAFWRERSASDGAVLHICAIGVLNKQYGDSYEEAAIRACTEALKARGAG